MATFDQACEAKQEFRKRFPDVEVVSLGIVKVLDGFAIKVGVSDASDRNACFPSEMSGVPLVVEVIGIPALEDVDAITIRST